MAQRVSDGTTADDRLKGTAAGAVAGLVASWVMAEFTTIWTRMATGQESQSVAGRHDARDWQERSERRNATELLPERLADATRGRPLSRDELRIAAPVAHYAFGATMGAVYGAAVENVDANPLTGAAWGTAVWFGADNIGVPALGLSYGPGVYTAEEYAQGFAAHLVYGIATELVRRAVRAIM